MKFGSVPVEEAAGAILAHSVRHGGGMIKKGTLLTKEQVEALSAAGLSEILVARLDPGDVHEDEAAERLADAIAGEGVRIEPPFTGRSNVYATDAGVLTVDRALIDRLNRVDPAITVATLPEYSPVEAGRMIATVKIIPFAVSREKLDVAAALGRAISVAAFRPLKVGLVATELPSLKPSVMEKTRRLLEERLAPAGATLVGESRVAHEAGAVGAALVEMKRQGNDLMVVFGASAMVDEHDVVPAGIVAAGGVVRHLGMPVDPGNLLVLGEIGGTPVVGAPGCARSPKENGFDWILNRLLAELEVTPEDVTGLGVGGLLMEIVSRPQPREGGVPRDEAAERKVAVLILAAGQSRRMGGPNKLLATIGDKSLVRRAAEAGLASGAASVTVVTGHRAEEIEGELTGLTVSIVRNLDYSGGLHVKIVRNPDYRGGLSTSLKAGLASLPKGIDGALVMLADMPQVDSQVIDRLIAAFQSADRRKAVVPTYRGKRGNPVLWPVELFPKLMGIRGDTGGRAIIDGDPDVVVEVEIGPAVATDIDTPEALAAAGGKPAARLEPAR